MDDKKEILVRLVEDALNLVADQNGNHVIQKCIECIEPASALNPLVAVSIPWTLIYVLFSSTSANRPCFEHP